jgi:hypothetical protein
MKEPKSKPKTMGVRTDRVSQTPSPHPAPLRSTAFKSEDGQRMTKVDYGPYYQAPVVWSADFLMDNARKHPGLLIPNFHWHFILPWLASPKADISKFWKSYEGEGAEGGRKIAVYGPKIPNRQNEQILLGVVHEYQALSLQKFGFGSGQDVPSSLLANVNLSEIQRIEQMQNLKERMVDWILDAVWNDVEAPKRLHELLKNKKTAKSEYDGQKTANGRIFEAFVDEITQYWKLPTKKAVRMRAKLGSESSGRSSAAAAFKSMGLGGLPEG